MNKGKMLIILTVIFIGLFLSFLIYTSLKDGFNHAKGTLVWCEYDNDRKIIWQYSFSDEKRRLVANGQLVSNSLENGIVWYCSDPDTKETVFYALDGDKKILKLGTYRFSFDQIVEYTNEGVYFVIDRTLYSIDIDGVTKKILTLQGDDAYLSILARSPDGKWAYDYRENSEYYVCITDKSGWELHCIQGICPVWKDATCLAYVYPRTQVLMTFDMQSGLNHEWRDEKGSPIKTVASINSTGKMVFDIDNTCIAYFSYNPWKVLLWEMGQNDGVAIYVTNLASGKTKRLSIASKTSSIRELQWNLDC